MLDPVYAVELEPGRLLLCPYCDGPFTASTVEEAKSELAWESHGYPNARVVRFKLEEVRDDDA